MLLAPGSVLAEAFDREVEIARAYSPLAENVREHLVAWLAKCVRLDVDVQECGPFGVSAHLTIRFDLLGVNDAVGF